MVFFVWRPLNSLMGIIPSFVSSWNLHKVELFSVFISYLDDLSSWKCSWKCKSLQFQRKNIDTKESRILSSQYDSSIVFRRKNRWRSRVRIVILCRFISTIPRVTQIGPSLCFGWFFLVCCFIRFEKCVVISWLSVFCSFTLLYLPPGCFLVRRVWPYHSALASPRAVPVG